jgi:hypothetical protein
MLSPALVLSLLACATAHTPDLGELPADLPPWGAALFAKVGAMEGEITTMKTTIATQNDMLKVQGKTIADNSARIQELETRAPQASASENVRTDPDNGAIDVFSALEQDEFPVGEGNSSTTRSRKQSAPSCGPSYVTARTQSVMGACCPGLGGGHHRRLQASCSLPDTCGTMQCADNFVSFYQDCTELVGNSLLYQRFYANCQELKGQSAQMLLQPVTVQMFKVHIATNMTAGPPPSPPASSSGDSSTELQEYHAVCSSAAISDCVPACNATHHGYELLATIDGTDTKFSCNVAHGLYSWMGAASEGGYLGADSASFFSAVVSGAAGTYMLTLTKDADVSTDLTIQPGQNVIITGDPSLSAVPSWGSGGFAVQQFASLSLTRVSLDGVVERRQGSLTLSDCVKSGVQLPASLRATGISDVWSSGVTRNKNGKAFTLFMLPRQAANYFRAAPGSCTSNCPNYADATGAHKYAEVCALAGLNTVVTGHPDKYPSTVYCAPGYTPPNQFYPPAANFECMPVVTDDAANAGSWVQRTTHWDSFVVFASETRQYQVYGYLYAVSHGGAHNDAYFQERLHPICMREL